MKVDGAIPNSIAKAATAATAAEEFGYDAAFTAETSRDPFLPLVAAAGATESLDIGTGIAVAFARSPMTLANTAYDLNEASKGRLILGLGSQIKPHITKRFSMEWSKPAARMREYVSAMRAIWASWMGDGSLDFRGDFYQHTLMTPFFNPGPNEYGAPRVWLAAVGPLMTQEAGEVADGLICHAFTTEKYLRETTLPAIEEGRRKAGKSMDDFEISGPFFVVTGTTEEEMAKATQGTKQQIAFYGSTPAYRPVLEAHGWGDLQTELNTMSKQGKWEEMANAIDDEVLDAFAVVGEPEEVAPKMLKRYGDVVDRVSFYAPYETDRARWQAMLQTLQQG